MLAEEIAACALDQYERALSKAKPKDKNEWTVYAAIVAERENRCWVVSCATGTKCTSSRMHGCILHDSHAEVLARRGFVRVLWLELIRRDMGETCDSQCKLLDNATPNECNIPFQLQSGTQLHLYISDSPCGDASIYSLDEQDNGKILYTGAKIVVSRGTGIDSTVCGNKTLEGTSVAREEKQILGKLRTKSGRSNLPAHLRSASMSCSDKIVKWCLLGLQGGLLSQLVAPIPLSSVIVSADARITKDRVPLGHESQREALERAIPRRVANAWVELSTLQNVDCSWDNFVPTTHVVVGQFPFGKAMLSSEVKKRGCDKKRKRDELNAARSVSPCGVCMNWQQSNPSSFELVVGARGLKQGKKPKSDKDYRCLSSRLCRREIAQLHQEYQQKHGKSLTSPYKKLRYQELKDAVANSVWKEVKSMILNFGTLAGWLRSGTEGDFELDW